MSWNGVVETQECLWECFRLFDINSYYYCNSGTMGYCCAPDSFDSNCLTNECSNDLMTPELSYAYCFKSNKCGDLELKALGTR